MTADSQPMPARDGATVGPRCGNNPNATLTAGDRAAVNEFKAYLARKAATRHTADSITDDALDALYGERDALLAERAQLVRALANTYDLTPAQILDEARIAIAERSA